MSHQTQAGLFVVILTICHKQVSLEFIFSGFEDLSLATAWATKFTRFTAEYCSKDTHINQIISHKDTPELMATHSTAISLNPDSEHGFGSIYAQITSSFHNTASAQ